VNLPPYVRSDGENFLLLLKVQPRASSDSIGKVVGSELQIKLRAAPVDNAANEALLEFLARKLGCRRNQLELARGHTSRHKSVRVHGGSATDLLEGLRPMV
jgi:uncharacterized protein (TIGR00251 family)